MGGIPTRAFRSSGGQSVATGNIHIASPIEKYEIEELCLKLFPYYSERPVAIFLTDYIFYCEKLTCGIKIVYYSPISGECTSYYFTILNSTIFSSLLEALNEVTFRPSLSEKTLASENVCGDGHSRSHSIGSSGGHGFGAGIGNMLEIGADGAVVGGGQVFRDPLMICDSFPERNVDTIDSNRTESHGLTMRSEGYSSRNNSGR